MDRRIFGIETEFGVTCTFHGQRRLSPDEVARYLFRKVVAWGRSSNVFMANGSRLYLDVGSHPEYATAECDDISSLVAQDRAGERILEGLLIDAGSRLHDEGIVGDLYLFKNNTDSAGNSYGCHENYLIERNDNFERTVNLLLPFLVTRQLICGAGKVLQTSRGSAYCLSQRADHMWEGTSSATTRSRPMVNTRDEPHADAALYRRLHVIVGDSNMSETTTFLKVSTTDLVLRLLESGLPLPDLSMENSIRAIREVSHDISGQALIRLADGRSITGLQIQREYLTAVTRFVGDRGLDGDPAIAKTLELWSRTLTAVETGNHSLINRDIDWAIKLNLLHRYMERDAITLDHPRIAQIDLTYHDISRNRGLFYLLERKGMVSRVVRDIDIFQAKSVPPQTTRARLRGAFVRAAQNKNAEYSVDWVHLKAGDQAGRTVQCTDPFASVDERVDRLIASL